jgi:hypothetical protein
MSQAAGRAKLRPCGRGQPCRATQICVLHTRQSRAVRWLNDQPLRCRKCRPRWRLHRSDGPMRACRLGRFGLYTGRYLRGAGSHPAGALFTLLRLYFVVFLPWRWVQGQKQILNGPVRTVETKQEATSIAVPDRKGNSSRQSLLLPIHNSVDSQRSVELSNPL